MYWIYIWTCKHWRFPKNLQYDFPKKREAQRPLGTFQKIHLFWYWDGFPINWVSEWYSGRQEGRSPFPTNITAPHLDPKQFVNILWSLISADVQVIAVDSMAINLAYIKRSLEKNLLWDTEIVRLVHSAVRWSLKTTTFQKLHRVIIDRDVIENDWNMFFFNFKLS